MGLIHIYCGDGKGKTTAAMGLTLRCVGGGGRALVYQFLKDGTSGEIGLMKNIDGVEVYDGYKLTGFCFNPTDEEKNAEVEKYAEDMEYISERVHKEQFDLLVLDEVLHAVNMGYVQLNDLLDFLKNRPEKTEVVLTGRNPKSELISIADYVSEIKKVKHPFDKGIGARKYVEF
jgi:cob(I)alamin adenosyltransferase